jgi:hypothetical protein
MNKFDVMDMLNAIKYDNSLTAAGKGFLFAAALCTSNETGRVKESLEGLSHYAGMSGRTQRRIMADDRTVSKYFDTSHYTRHVNLTWRPLPVILSDSDYVKSTRPEENAARREAAATEEPNATGHSVHATGHIVHTTGHIDRPSTLSSTPSSTEAPAEPVEETEYDPFSPLLDRYKTTLEEVTPLLTTEDSGRESAVVEELTETVEDMNISLATLEVEETNESEDSSLLDTAKKKYAAVPFQGRTAAAYSIEARACMKDWDKTGADADMAAAAEYLVLTNEFMPENIDGGSRFGWACVEINKWRSEAGALTW